MRGAGRDGVVGAGPAERRPGRHQALRGLRRQLHQQVLGPRQEEERTVSNKKRNRPHRDQYISPADG